MYVCVCIYAAVYVVSVYDYMCIHLCMHQISIYLRMYVRMYVRMFVNYIKPYIQGITYYLLFLFYMFEFSPFSISKYVCNYCS